MARSVTWRKRLRYYLARLRTRSRFRFAGQRFQVAPGVLNPTLFRASFFFARQALAQAPPVPADVLELGCGCGLASIALAAQGHRVTAVDLDPQALENTRSNGEHNGISLTVLQSDWGDALNKRYDYIVSNPPFMASRPVQMERALYAGSDLEHLAGLVASLAKCLAPDGRALVMTASLTDRDFMENQYAERGLNLLKTVTKRDWEETLFADLLCPEV